MVLLPIIFLFPLGALLFIARRVNGADKIRGAAAEGRPDTTRFRADTSDWLRGDTVVARFDTTISRDSTSRARLRELIARGSAKSFYHMAAADSSVHRPAIGRDRYRFFCRQVFAGERRSHGAQISLSTGPQRPCQQD